MHKVYRICNKHISECAERLLKSLPSIVVLWCQLAVAGCVWKEAGVVIQHFTLAELQLLEDLWRKKIHSSGIKCSFSPFTYLLLFTAFLLFLFDLIIFHWFPLGFS